MAKKKLLSKTETARIDAIVAVYTNDRTQATFRTVLDGLRSALLNHPELPKYTHSLRSRLKDPDHLRDKLVRKATKAKNGEGEFDITPENVFDKIHDLVGARILHLYTDQIRVMNGFIKDALSESHVFVEGPVAHCWDTETENYFKSIGFDVNRRDSMYASVHYVMKASRTSPIHCELQVRTLAEEIFGEVSHTIDYPHPSGSVACAEQLRVLARICSGTTRLVDSVFRSHSEFKNHLEGNR